MADLAITRPAVEVGSVWQSLRCPETRIRVIAKDGPFRKVEAIATPGYCNPAPVWLDRDFIRDSYRPGGEG